MTRILWHISTKKLPKMLEYTLGRVGFSDFFFEFRILFLLEYRSAHLYIFKFHSYLEICLLFLMQKLNKYKIWSISTNKLPKMQGYILGRESFFFSEWISCSTTNSENYKSWIIQGDMEYWFSNFSCMFLNPNNFFQFKF